MKKLLLFSTCILLGLMCLPQLSMAGSIGNPTDTETLSTPTTATTPALTKAERKAQRKQMRALNKEVRKAAWKKLWNKDARSEDDKVLAIIVALFIPPLGLYLYTDSTDGPFKLDLLLYLAGFALVALSLIGIPFVGALSSAAFLASFVYALLVILDVV